MLVLYYFLNLRVFHKAFKVFTIRGGILIPFGKRDEKSYSTDQDVETRIVLGVPIGKIFEF